MREIKFRAWDKKAKGWLDDLLANDYQEKGWEYNPYDKDEWWTECGNMQARFDTFGDRLVYEQYTGLKDKNGKEIYEGDWISLKEKSGVGYGNGPVTFQKGSFFIHDMVLYDVYSEDLDSEIIGNIHENPELLEDK